MSQINQVRQAMPVYNHAGARAVHTSALRELRRTLLNCLLWEDNFYESGVAVADRIKSLVPKVPTTALVALVAEARNDFGLRHAPLLVVREMARSTPEHRKAVPAALMVAVRRPDEIAEFLAMYWADNDGKKFVSHPVRRGLAAALQKFNTHAIAKWDRKGKEVRIRDAMFMSHAKPADRTEKRVWSRVERKADFKAGSQRAWPFTERETVQFQLAQDLLVQTGTWEDRLSAGEDARVVFTDLMEKGDLGALAFIRNVRKMTEAGVDRTLIMEYSKTVKLWGVFPHQLITAARHNVAFESMFDAMLLRCTADMPKLSGLTVVLVDVSGSMKNALAERPKPGVSSYKGKKPYAASALPATTRLDAACAVAAMARELCDDVRIYTFSEEVVQVPDRHGMALMAAIDASQHHYGTRMAKAIRDVNTRAQYDRLIVISDEQSQDGSTPANAGANAYMMNVAPYKCSVSNDAHWSKIDGWSPTVIRYITQLEAESDKIASASVLD